MVGPNHTPECTLLTARVRVSWHSAQGPAEEPGQAVLASRACTQHQVHDQATLHRGHCEARVEYFCSAPLSDSM